MNSLQCFKVQIAVLLYIYVILDTEKVSKDQFSNHVLYGIRDNKRKTGKARKAALFDLNYSESMSILKIIHCLLVFSVSLFQIRVFRI